MKRILTLVLAALMLLATVAFAEEGQTAPMYATVGEAMADDAEGRVVAGGIPGEYFAVVNLKNGQYVRSVALCDEKLNELEAAVDSLDYEAEDYFEQFEAAMNAADEYRRTLPIAYSEVFTAQPLTAEEMASKVGKTLSELEEEGFEFGGSGTEPGEGEDEILIVYTLRYGVYDYSCQVDADFDTYIDAQENNTAGGLVVKALSVAGITERGFDRRFHTDGTVDEPQDPFAELGQIMLEFQDLIQRAQAGEAVDMAEFVEGLKERYPDYAEMIDMYVTMYESYGAEGLAAMMAPAE